MNTPKFLPEYGSEPGDIPEHLKKWHGAEAPEQLLEAVLLHADLHVHGEFAFQGFHCHKRAK